jgi:hypothetical protein
VIAMGMAVRGRMMVLALYGWIVKVRVKISRI